MEQEKKKIFAISTGGTIEQKPNINRSLTPANVNIFEIVEGLDEIADVTTIKTASLDSTNMTTQQRATLAEQVYNNYHYYDGFVIAHGTDTMVETAAALTYMLQGLGKPVVLTGAQKSVFARVSDAPKNIVHAIKTATMDLGEVVITFGDNILRGVRAIKTNEHGFNAFTTPRVPALGHIGHDFLDVNQRNLAPHRARQHDGHPEYFVDFETGIACYQSVSGADIDLLNLYEESKEVKGVVFCGFGAGNVPTKLLPGLERIITAHKPVVVITPCIEGEASTVYQVGAQAQQAGAIVARDLTREAATQKLMYALGKAEAMGCVDEEKMEFVERTIVHSLAGDMSRAYNPYRPKQEEEAK